ncbi:MAG: tRNA (adenosine(37)-N6)-threonylcarbamoyltransferase complex ATPase subunit type 1 TsaE [Acidimicrobiales bacterium]
MGGLTMERISARTRSVDETRKLGAAVAELCRPGDVILLAGDLGAGKTALVQGIGAAFGIDEPITSPTFVLARQYQGRFVLHHLDVYRLDQLDEVYDIGLPEMLDDSAVVVIEWGDAIATALPADYLEVRLTLGDDDDDERMLVFRSVGGRWRNRMTALKLAVLPWIDDAPSAPAPAGS